jgi:Flp pilus assembly protein TadG
MSVNRRRKDESGAVAIMFAVLGVLLLSIAALAVDLGNSRRPTSRRSRRLRSS